MKDDANSLLLSQVHRCKVLTRTKTRRIPLYTFVDRSIRTEDRIPDGFNELFGWVFEGAHELVDRLRRIWIRLARSSFVFLYSHESVSQ